MGEDVGREVGGVRGDKGPFAERGEGEEVSGEVGDGAGGAEWESEEVITKGREDVEDDGRVARCSGQERVVL